MQWLGGASASSAAKVANPALKDANILLNLATAPTRFAQSDNNGNNATGRRDSFSNEPANRQLNNLLGGSTTKATTAKINDLLKAKMTGKNFEGKVAAFLNNLGVTVEDVGKDIPGSDADIVLEKFIVEVKQNVNTANESKFISQMKRQFEYAASHGKELILYTDTKLNTLNSSVKNWMKALNDAGVKYKIIDDDKKLFETVKKQH